MYNFEHRREERSFSHKSTSSESTIHRQIRKHSHSSNSSSSRLGDHNNTSDSEQSTDRSQRNSRYDSGQAMNYYTNKQKCDGLVKLLMIGDTSVGKSSLIQRYVDDDFQFNWIATIGIDIRLKVVPMHGKNFKVQIWDTAGQERFRNITRSHFRGVHGVMITYDVTSRESFEKLDYWIKMASGALHNDAPRVIVGNKIDLEDRRCVSIEEASTFCRSFGIPYVETSARTGENVDFSYFNLVKECLKVERILGKERPQGVVRIGKKEPVEPRSCC